MKKTVSIILLAVMLLMLLPASASAAAPGYTVEFHYGERQYVLNGDSSVKLSEILAELCIPGKVTRAEVSDPSLFTAEKAPVGDDWTVTVLRAFSTGEWLKVTADGRTYEIVVTDEQEPVPYLYWDDAEKELVEGSCAAYTVIDASTMEPHDGYVLESGKWYVLKGTATFNFRIENNAAKDTPAHLILTDGCSMNANMGIRNASGHGLCIYGQAKDTGTLTVPLRSSSDAGIGGNDDENSGILTVNGGTLNVTGGKYGGAGIGGGSHGSPESITINGGTVNANGGDGGAGIGGGSIGAGGTITVNGGTINAYGGNEAAGIGGGQYGAGGIVTINGGKIYAQGLNTVEAIGRGWGHGALSHGSLRFGVRPVKVLERSNVITPEELEKNHDMYNPVTVEYKKAGYTVKHWKQKELFKDDYELIDTETLSWFIGNDTRAVAKDIPGYSPSFTQAKVKEDGTTVIEIRYNIIYYTISFDMRGHGEPVKAISALPGATVSTPATPSEEGFVFEGWYTDTAYTDKYQFSVMPSHDLTLYAKWTTETPERRDIPYVDESGNTVTVSCIIVPADQKNYVFTEGEWYAVTGDAVIENRIDTRAPNGNPAHLILTDGCSLNAKGGIECAAGKGLVIYGQSAGTGTLTATGGSAARPGIGGVDTPFTSGSGDITINGGTVIATGGRVYWPSSMNYSGYAGIGNNGGNVSINGGTVIATGGDPGGPGIACGITGSFSSVTINGGTVTATGATSAPGIGCGSWGGTATVAINGGTVTATGGNGADGIGVGPYSGSINITVNGGEITATGGTGKAGIGGKLAFGTALIEVKAGASKAAAEDLSAETYLEKHADYLFAHLKGVKQYKIIKGANQTILKNATSAVFASDAPFDKFVRVEVDGKKVSSKYYTAKSGSTVITFNKAYISKLAKGKHTLCIVSADGSASTIFWLKTVPVTGDDYAPLLWAMLLPVSGALLLISAATRKRKKDTHIL